MTRDIPLSATVPEIIHISIQNALLLVEFKGDVRREGEKRGGRWLRHKSRSTKDARNWMNPLSRTRARKVKGNISNFFYFLLTLISSIDYICKEVNNKIIIIFNMTILVEIEISGKFLFSCKKGVFLLFFKKFLARRDLIVFVDCTYYLITEKFFALIVIMHLQCTIIISYHAFIQRDADYQVFPCFSFISNNLWILKHSFTLRF